MKPHRVARALLYVSVVVFAILVGFKFLPWAGEKSLEKSLDDPDFARTMNAFVHGGSLSTSSSNLLMQKNSKILFDQNQAPSLESSRPMYVEKPEHVKALYMTSWIASSSRLREPIIDLIKATEINSIVLDIKDDTGKIAFTVQDPLLQIRQCYENRISDLDDFIQELHQENIYVIGRISVFQDPCLAEKHPELALKNKQTGGVWKDHKGLSFLDVTNPEVHHYIITIAKEAHRRGFDEINFDYVRYPSDGVIRDIDYQLVEGETRADNLEHFFQKLALLRDDMNISVDIFGMTTSNYDDLGIGQVLEKTMPYFDAVAPMIYPSHYPLTWKGIDKPAEYPYEVIFKAMADGILRAENAGYTKEIFRPWIQDFNLGAVYTADKVRAQIQALEDLGIFEFMIWDPANTYTQEALKKEEVSQDVQ